MKLFLLKKIDRYIHTYSYAYIHAGRTLRKNIIKDKEGIL